MGTDIQAPSQQTIQVVLDSRITWNPDLDLQRQSLRRLFRAGQRGAEAVRSLDRLKVQLTAFSKRIEELDDEHPGRALTPAVDSLSSRVDTLRESLARKDSDRPGSEAVLSKIQGIYGQIARSTNAPTAPQTEWAEAFLSELDAVLTEVSAVMVAEADRLNERVREAGIPAVGGG